MQPQDYVFIGIWINHTASNSFNSCVLTLTNRWSFVVLATLAILITYASAKCWAIIRFIVFWWLETFNAPPDRDYLCQLELVLRNSATAIATSGGYFNVWRRWKRNANRQSQPLKRFHVAFVILLGLFHNFAFIILGAFMPLTLIDSPEKLSGRKETCGYWPIDIDGLINTADDDMLQNILGQHAHFIANGTAAATAYVRSCYGPEPEMSTCDVMINRRIPWTGINNAPCPFAAGQCVGGDNAAFTMDTGNITASYYGINTKSSLTMWRQSTCAPIIMKPYQCNNDDGHGYCHFTYDGANRTMLIRNDLADPYQVKGWFPHQNFTVHPNLQPEVGNVSLVYISRNNLPHLYQTEDPIFKAMEKLSPPERYVLSWEDRVTALGCVEKLKVCGNFNGRTECSPWTGVVKGENGETGLESLMEKCSEHEKGLISLLLPKTPVLQTIGDAARGSGSDLIASRSLLFIPSFQTEIQTARGNEQWKEEVAQWFNIVLGISQLAVFHFPISPPFLDTSLLENQMMPQSQFICNNVLINSSKHTTIRFAGLVLVAVGSMVVTLLCYAGNWYSTCQGRRRPMELVLQKWTRLSYESPETLATSEGESPASKSGEETPHQESDLLVPNRNDDIQHEDSEGYGLEVLIDRRDNLERLGDGASFENQAGDT